MSGDQKHQPRCQSHVGRMLLLKEVHVHPKPKTTLHSIHGGGYSRADGKMGKGVSSCLTSLSISSSETWVEPVGGSHSYDET